MELSKEEKAAVLNQVLKALAMQIYDQTISAKVAKTIGNDEQLQKTQKALELLTKTNQGYEKELSELELTK
jgi:hypothetical protein